MNIKITQEADDRGKGMTLRELSVFVTEAIRSDMDPEEPVRAHIGWRGQLQSINVPR